MCPIEENCNRLKEFFENNKQEISEAQYAEALKICKSHNGFLIAISFETMRINDRIFKNYLRLEYYKDAIYEIFPTREATIEYLDTIVTHESRIRRKEGISWLCH